MANSDHVGAVVALFFTRKTTVDKVCSFLSLCKKENFHFGGVSLCPVGSKWIEFPKQWNGWECIVWGRKCERENLLTKYRKWLSGNRRWIERIGNLLIYSYTYSYTASWTFFRFDQVSLRISVCICPFCWNLSEKLLRWEQMRKDKILNREFNRRFQLCNGNSRNI